MEIDLSADCASNDTVWEERDSLNWLCRMWYDMWEKDKREHWDFIANQMLDPLYDSRYDKVIIFMT